MAKAYNTQDANADPGNREYEGCAKTDEWGHFNACGRQCNGPHCNRDEQRHDWGRNLELKPAHRTVVEV